MFLAGLNLGIFIPSASSPFTTSLENETSKSPESRLKTLPT